MQSVGRPYTVLDCSAEDSPTVPGTEEASLFTCPGILLLSSSPFCILTLRPNLKIELSPKDDLDPAFELPGESISDDLEA